MGRYHKGNFGEEALMTFDKQAAEGCADCTMEDPLGQDRIYYDATGDDYPQPRIAVVLFVVVRLISQLVATSLRFAADKRHHAL